MPEALFKCKAPLAEFDAALDPLWISAKEPFKGAKKDTTGFVVTLKVVPTDPPAPAPLKPVAAAVKK